MKQENEKTPIQITVENNNGNDCVTLTGLDMIRDTISSSLNITPSQSKYPTMTEMGIKQTDICLVRLQSAKDIKDTVLNVGKLGKDYLLEKLFPEHRPQKGIWDVTKFDLNDGLGSETILLSEWTMSIKPKSKVVVTFFHSEIWIKK